MANVVLFMLDQLAMRWLEVPGATPTPHIDALRARGTTFRQCISSNPVCCPARATLATGLSSRGHGVLQNGYGLDPAIPTFMRGLQAAGWRTGAFGKLHFQPHFAGLHPDYRPYGFDVAHITEDGRGGDWLDHIIADHPEHLDDVLATLWATSIPELADYGPDHLDLAARIQAIRRDYQWATPEDPHATPQRYTLRFPEALSQTAWITRQALGWLGEQRPGEPFFAQISYVQPHGPFGTPARMMPLVDRDCLPAPAAPEWVDDPDGPACFAGKGKTAIPADWRETRHYYFADIAHLDEQLGQVTAALESAGLLGETTIMLLADHGEMLLDHGLMSKGEFHYDACIRVPLIVAGPSIQASQVRSEPVQLEDIAPTILELAGRQPETPRTMGPYLRQAPAPGPGRSLLPLCRGEAAPADWRRVAYAESYNNIDSLSPIHWARTVTDGSWRYTWYPQGAGEQLFHLADDPGEQHNRVRDPDCQATRDRLRSELLEQVVLQDLPHTPRSLFALGVH